MINPLENEWVTVKLGSVCQLQNGFAFKSEDYKEQGVHLIRISDIQDGSVLPDKTVKILNKPEYEKFVVKKGDILIAMSGATTGKFGIYQSDEKAYLNQRVGCFKILDKEAIGKDFLYYLITGLKKKIEKDAYGGAQPNIASNKVEAMYVSYPKSLKTQRQIAQLLSRAEELIADRQLSLTLLDDFLKSTFLDLFGDPVKNEKAWRKEPLGNYLRRIDSGWSPVCLDEPKANDSEWAVLKLGAVTSRYFKPGENKKLPDDLKPRPAIEVRTGDLLFSRKNTRELVGACVLVFDTPPGLMMSDTIFRLVPKEELQSYYLWYLLNDKRFRKEVQLLASGSSGSMPNISKERLSNLAISIPPLPLQTRFAEIVNHVESLKTQQRESLTQFRNLYKSLLQQAFAGELDVSAVKLRGEVDEFSKERKKYTDETKVLIARSKRRSSGQRSALKTKLLSAVRRTATDTLIQSISSESASLMKLLKLTLYDSFRSLPANFSISFLPDNTSADKLTFSPYCLVGPNGSGKSNVLEVLAAIFYHIDCIYLTSKPNGFEKDEEQPDRGFDATVCQPDAFELTYLTRAPSLATPERPNPLWHITISKAIGSRPIIRGYERRENRFDESPSRELNRTEVTQVLPELVVGYSSGENEVLSLPFYKMRFLHYDEYLDRLSNQFDYAKPEGRLVYLDNQFSEAVLLANYLMQPPSVMQPVYDVIGIERVTSFKLIIRQSQCVPLQALDGKLRAYPEQFQGIASSSMSKTAELTSLLGKSVVDKLSQCATTRTETSETLNGLSGTYSILILEFQVTATMQRDFRQMFNNDPLTLFRAFQILFTLNLCTVDDTTKRAIYDTNSLYISEMIPTSPNNQRIATFEDVIIQKREEDGFQHKIPIKALSDGEYQFLHSMGICLLLKDTNALFLLDEPETHFNPDWRARFISTLNQCLQANESRESIGELLITSHSPFIVSDCRPDNVLIFKRGQNSPDRPSFNTFGASVDNISMNVFEKTETIANEANSMLKKWRRETIESQADIDRLRVNARQLGDSIEKIMFLNYLREQEKALPVTSDK